MLVTIMRKEWRLLVRSGRVLPLFAAWLLLSVLAALAASAVQQRAEADRAAASLADQRSWEGQGPRNPHSAAHFGQIAFKPATRLAAIEPGLDAWVGASIWMEAHYQNPAQHRAGEDLTPLSRMGSLSLGWMLQVLLPLTLLVLGYDLLAEERGRGAIRLQRVAGASATMLLGGKALALATAGLLVTAPAWIAAAVTVLGADAAGAPDVGVRLLLWLGSYAAYCAVWVALTLVVSGLAGSVRASFAILAGVWLVTVLLLPRLAAEQAEAAYPAPDVTAFWSAIRNAQSEGVNGHDPRDARRAALEQKVMQEYGVTRREDLPVSFAGIALQAGEEYGDQVHDRFMGSLWNGYASQAAVLRAWAVVAPVLAVRDVAMHAAGTDVVHHRDFAQAAERHRRRLQKYLNDDLTKHGRGKDFDYQAPESVWRDAPRFSYAPPPTDAAPGAGGVLLLWLLCGVAACAFVAGRLDRGAAA